MPRLSKLSRSIAGRTALVTGAASGMGRATAQLFADEGARVAVADRDEVGVERVVDEIVRAGGNAAGSRSIWPIRTQLQSSRAGSESDSARSTS
jgi:3-oxoacyl-[acyl-carrier protein] reductase